MRLNDQVAEIRRTHLVAAEPQAVWDVLADFGAISSWADNVDHSCLLSPAAVGVGVGTTRRVQIGRDTLVERITEFDPPHALAYHVEGFPRALRAVRNRWTLRSAVANPAGASISVVTLTCTIGIGSGPLRRLGERIIARFAARQLEAVLTGLLNGLTRRVEDSHV